MIKGVRGRQRNGMNVLLVDDDIYSIEGLKSGIKWEKLNIHPVYEAVNVIQAKKILQQNHIDIMLCDIEMPGKNGLELLEWLEEEKIEVLTIYYSCHADFSYAQKALGLKAFDYLLKPMPYEKIEEVIEKATVYIIEEKNKLNQQKTNINTYQKQKEEFYRACIQRVIPTNVEELVRVQKVMGIDTHEIRKIDIIVLKIEDYEKALSVMSQFDIDFCIKNMVGDVFDLWTEEERTIIPYQNQFYVIVLEENKKNDVSLEIMQQKCDRLSRSFNRLLSTKLNYEYMQGINIENFADMIEKLMLHLEVEKSDGERKKVEVIDKEIINDWKDDLFQMRMESLNKKIHHFLNERETAGQTDFYFLEMLYRDYTYLAFSVLSLKQVDSREIVNTVEYRRGCREARWSRKRLEKYIIWLNESVIATLQKNGTKVDSVENIKQYIEIHIEEEIVREQLAAEMHMNPDYMSRLFRNKTGVSLTQYITNQKIERVKENLSIPGMTISNAAAKVGYTNFSYFCSLFKKMTGQTPSEYCSMLKERKSF